MSEIEKKVIATNSITKAAKLFDQMSENTVQGIKVAASLERQITEAERAQRESEANPVIEEENIPTGAEIRQALEEGEYR